MKTNTKLSSETNAETEVNVRRQWNDYKIARVKADNITGLHFSSISGGVGRPSPRPFLCGYVSCDAILSGDIAHSCQHGNPPHLIKVCLVKKDNEPQIYRRLAELANEKK